MVSKIEEEELIEWIKKSCGEQGKAIYIEDPTLISQLVVLLRTS